MPNLKLLKALKELDGTKPFLKQTLVYPYIDEKSISLIKNDFPEYNPIEEIPLLFCKGYSEDYELRWLFISNKRFYYRIAITPPVLTSLDCISLQRIYSLRIRCRWVLNYIELNGIKLGTIVISSIRETLFLKSIIKIILKYSDSTEPDVMPDIPKINYFPPDEWQHLQNAVIFPLVNDYFSKHNIGGRLWGFYFFYTHPFIKQEKMALARQEYADYDPAEEIPFLFIENAGNTTAGIVITNKYIYYNLSPSIMKKEEKNKIALDKLNSFNVKTRLHGWIFINDQRKGLTNAFDFLDRKASRVFQELINLIIEEVHKNKKLRSKNGWGD